MLTLIPLISGYSVKPSLLHNIKRSLEGRQGNGSLALCWLLFSFYCCLINSEVGDDMSRLKLENIQIRYGKQIAVEDFSIDVKERSFIVLAGPSGCGKTSLLQAIAGLVPVESGSMEIDGVCVDKLEPGKRNIAMVFQDGALFPHMSVRENIVYGLAYGGMGKEEIDEAVTAICDMLKIQDLLSRKADTLSGGQKQRVAIARALVRKPSLFLMDEPLSSLDARLKTQLRIEIAQLYSRMDSTFVYVTHDQMEAMTLADVLVIMKEGKIQQIGEPMEVYRHPVNVFTASFLGKFPLNRFKGYVRDRTLYWQGRRLPLRTCVENQDVIIGVRSEHMMLDDDSEVKGMIVLVENVGDEVYYHLTWEDQILIIKGNIHRLYKIGDEVGFHFHWRNALFFDADSEEAIHII